MNWLDLREIVKSECQLRADLPLLLGVSGGPDSLCMLDILHRLEYSLVVAHFDHGLRPDSSQDAEKVAQIANKLGLPFMSDRGDVKELALANHLSIEEAARKARYHFLFEQARQVGAQAVAVAHTADDQVETVLMHLLRGAGLSGLKGMNYRSLVPEWDKNLPLVRPLLGTWRREVLEYCQDRGLDPQYDPTNQETVFFRNRLRHELIPYLEGYNPQVRKVIWRTAHGLAADHEVLQEYLQAAWKRCLLDAGSGYVILSRPALDDLALAQKRSVIRQAIGLLRPSLRDIDFSDIRRALEFLETPSATGQIDLVSNLRMFIEGEKLFLAEWGTRVLDHEWPQLSPGACIPLNIPSSIILGGGFRLEIHLENLVPAEKRLRFEDDPFQAWLDASTLTLPLTLRTRLPGDRFRPLGMEGHSQKLADFMINHHLQARARPGWPLLCSADQIAWVPGFQPAFPFRLTAASQTGLHLVVKQIPPNP